jgi:uncharacterized protein (TIGR02453 family)
MTSRNQDGIRDGRDGSSFPGFPRECVQFWIDLREHNSKGWFEPHREDYQRFVLEPSRQFVVAMGERLRSLSPHVNAVPVVNKSLFRLRRDTRFSRDKRPYKTYMGIYLWEGEGKRLECSGYYFHLEPPELTLGVGIYVLPKPLIPRYRDAVTESERGQKLSKAIARVTSAGPYTIGGEHYRRVPRGYDASHPRADLLRHNGLYAAYRTAIPEELHTSAVVDYCFDRYADMSPLHYWLVAVLENSTRGLAAGRGVR